MTDKELAEEYVDKLYAEKVSEEIYDKDGEGTCLDCEWGTCLFGGGKGAVCLHTGKKNINELTRCEKWTKKK